jgi:hypothetical protein
MSSSFQDPTWYLAVRYLSSLLTGTDSQTLPVADTLDISKSIHQVFCRMSLFEICWTFSHDRLGHSVRRATKVMGHFVHVTSRLPLYILSAQQSLWVLAWTTWLRVLVRFLPTKLPQPHTLPPEGSHHVQSTFQSRVGFHLLEGSVSLWIIWNLSTWGNLTYPFSHLFIKPFIHTCGLTDSGLICGVAIQYN